MTMQPITKLASALRNAGYENAPKYRALYERALDGDIEVNQGENGRWTYSPDDLHKIADALGLKQLSEAA